MNGTSSRFLAYLKGLGIVFKVRFSRYEERDFVEANRWLCPAQRFCERSKECQKCIRGILEDIREENNSVLRQR